MLLGHGGDRSATASSCDGASLDLDGLLGLLTQHRDLSRRPEEIEVLDLPLKGALKIPRGFKNSLAELVAWGAHSPLKAEEKNLAEECLVRWDELDLALKEGLLIKREAQEQKLKHLVQQAELKPTKTNIAKKESARRVFDKIQADLAALEGGVGRSDPTVEAQGFQPLASSVFQYSWAPILVDLPERGKVLRFHRYQVRPRGSRQEPPSHLNMFNARLDSLTTRPTWSPLFMRQHGAIFLRGFYEWVPHPATQKPALIRFGREGGELFWVPCLYEFWRGKWSLGEFTLPSFAIVTTDPPAEVLRMGHDRCPIVPEQDHLSWWLRARDGASTLRELQKPHGVSFVHRWPRGTLPSDGG